MARTGALICLCALIMQKLPLPWPRHAGFLSVAGLIVFGNLIWLGWVLRLLDDLRRRPGPMGWAGRLRVGWVLYALLMLAPVFLLMFRRRWWDQWPALAIMWIMAWNLFLALTGAATTIGWLLVLAGRRLRTQGGPQPDSAVGHGSRRDAGPLPAGASPAISRRRVLMGAAAAPFAVSTAALAAGQAQDGSFIIRRIPMRLPRTPDRLRGLTITHVSDLHTGRLFRPEHLPRMIDAVNALGSDLIAVTGDIIDHSNDFLPAACDALAQLEARHGRYVVMGNHDLIDDSRVFVSYLQEREPNFLIDAHRTIEIGGERVQIAGLGWSRSDQKHRGDPGHERRAAAALARSDPDVFTLALAHHPHAFDALAPLGVDLTLAGHTHGGQLMLTPPGWPLRIGAGSMMFRYLWGEYHRDRSALFVNAGVGNWFPVRMNAPAEIVQIQLV